MNVYDYAHSLAKAIKGSPEHKALKNAAKKLENDPTAKKMLLDFRRAQLELQQQKMSGLEISSEQQEKLNKLYEVIYLNQTVKEYLEAEYRFSVLFADIQKIVAETVQDLFPADLINLEEPGIASEGGNENPKPQ